MAQVTVNDSSESFFSIHFDVRLANYPIFRTIKEDVPVYIEGRIKEIKYKSLIYIDLSIIDFNLKRKIKGKRTMIKPRKESER